MSKDRQCKTVEVEAGSAIRSIGSRLAPKPHLTGKDPRKERYVLEICGDACVTGLKDRQCKTVEVEDVRLSIQSAVAWHQNHT